METNKYKHHVVVAALLAVTGLAISVQPDLTVSEERGVQAVLPSAVGDFRGDEVLSCHNPACLQDFVPGDLHGERVCPICGGDLYPIAYAEKIGLPMGTDIVRKRYADPKGREIAAWIVLSGKEQKSLHRPQQCLPAGGYTIERSRTISVPLAGRPAMKVMLLDLRRTVSRPGEPGRHYFSAYAYWFVGKGRETPYHLERLIWMSADRILRNEAYRWAFVAVSTDRVDGSDSHVERLSVFIHDLHPFLVQASSPPARQ